MGGRKSCCVRQPLWPPSIKSEAKHRRASRPPPLSRLADRPAGRLTENIVAAAALVTVCANCLRRWSDMIGVRRERSRSSGWTMASEALVCAAGRKPASVCPCPGALFSWPATAPLRPIVSEQDRRDKDAFGKPASRRENERSQQVVDHSRPLPSSSPPPLHRYARGHKHIHLTGATAAAATITWLDPFVERERLFSLKFTRLYLSSDATDSAR